jgi:hypothetical protein
MLNAAKWLAPLAALLASVSTNLSIALVLGLSGLLVLPNDALRGARASPMPPPPIEVVRTRPVPLPEPVRQSSSIARAAPTDVSPLPIERPPARPSESNAEPEDAAEAPPEAAPADSAPIVVAARRRSRDKEDSEEREQQKSDPVRKNSGIATEEKPETAAPIPPPETKPETAQIEPPKPDVWSDAEVITALRECVRLLAPIAADVEVSQPVKHEQCGTPAPVALRRIGSGANKVEINPPATINCAMVASLHTWVERTLQPVAQETLGSPIVRLRNASGYSCRNRNGSALNSDKLSEHARANAIDIAGFVTADGRTIEVARNWGPTARDIRAAEKEAAERAREAKEASRKEPVKPEPAKADAGPVRKSSAIAAKPSEQERGRKDTPVQPSEEQKPARVDRDAKGETKSATAALSAEREAASKSAEGTFLRRLHRGACGTFGTVLGPEANEAHRDHFHLDLAERRRNAFCE